MGILGAAGQIAVVALPVALGYVLRRLGVMDEGFDRRLVTLILDVLLPCAVLSSLLSVDSLPGGAEVVEVMALMTGAMLLSWGVASFATRLMRVPREERGSYRFAMTFGNVGFIGFPVVASILGEEALLDAVLASIPGNVVMFTIGAAMFATPEEGEREGGCPGDGRLRVLLACLRTPTMVASVVTLACALAGIRSLGVVGEAVSVVGQASTPCALLVTGSSIARYDLTEMLRSPRAYLAALFRLLLVPLVCAGALRLLGPVAPRELATVVALECAMPVATNGVLYSTRSGQGVTAMMQVTFLSVVGSVLTIPVLCALLGA